MKGESISLRNQEGNSNKVYQVELKQDGSLWVVNFAYGGYGKSLKTGTKTKVPIDYEAALKVYNSLIKSKRSGGYKPEGDEGVNINTVDDKVDSGIRPQLLNEITVDEAEEYITNDLYCMQEKYDGERRMIQKEDSKINGINKKGFIVPLVFDCLAEMIAINADFILDGEDMGSKIMVFDNLTPGYANQPYNVRLKALELILSKQALDDCVQIVPTAWTTEEKRKMFKRLKAEGAEGVTFKQITNKYTAGRPSSGGGQYKCKFWESASVIVSSHHPTKSSITVKVFDESVGASEIVYPLVEVGNVTVKANQQKPKLGAVVEVRYLYYNEGGSLIQPELLSKDGDAVRTDVTLSECLLSKLKRPKQHA